MNACLWILPILAGTLLAQDLKPTPPQGWSMQTIDSGWVFKPDNLGEGKIFSAVITKKEKAQAKLKDYLDAVWAGLGDGAKRNEKVDEQTIGSWQSLFSFGTSTQVKMTLALTITVFQKGDEQFTSMTFADSAETHEKYAAIAGQIVGTMLGLVPGTPPSAPSSGPPTTFEVTFPAGWAREDKGAFRMARWVDSYDTRRCRLIILCPPEPVQGSLYQTYGRIWSREMTSGGISLMNAGLLSPESSPQPLRRRLKSGLVVWWEGGEGHFEGFECFTQLFMVEAENSVTPVLVIYRQGSTDEAYRAPIWQFLESFKPSAPVTKKELFTEKDCVGKWQLFLNGAMAGFFSTTGAYLGDASTGGIEDLELKSDGTYSRFLVAKSSNLAWTHREAGNWKVVDDTLTITPKGKSPEKFLIYGLATLDKKTNLLLGTTDGTRIPTCALENGSQIEIVIRGGSLFKYIKQGG